MEETTNYGLIFSYGIQMTITFVAMFLLYFTLIFKGDVPTFLYKNRLRFLMMLVNFWVLSGGLVAVPGFAQIFGGLGYNADMSTVGIAMLIVLAFIKTTDGATPLPPTDPIP